MQMLCFTHRTDMDFDFRLARDSDRLAIIEAFGEEPTEEQVAVAAGDPAKARRFRKALTVSLVSHSALARTIVAVRHDGDIAGFIQWGSESGDRVTPRLAWEVVRVFGVFGIRGFLQRDKIRARVAISAPENSFHIAEVHVLASLRGRGVGAALLRRAEVEAQRQGAAQLSLTTATNNVARRLYEREGFRVVETRTDPGFEAATGVAGRVLMVKPLQPYVPVESSLAR